MGKTGKLPSYFNDFLRDIRLTDNQVNDLKTGHKTLRKRLNADANLSKIIVNTFLQGSYRRATATRPKSGKRSDVDVVVVTNLDKEKYTPEEAHDLFIPFLEEHYKDKYRIQGRSLGIELSYVDLDLVVTAAPSESQKELLEEVSVGSDISIDDLKDWTFSKSQDFPKDIRSESFLLFENQSNDAEWKTEPLYIPNRDAEIWDPTDPLAQIKWTWEKNNECNKHYVNVVKALKWWRRIDDPDGSHPKSYPLEHLIGQSCPTGIESVAEGITLTLEAIVDDYPIKPEMPDHGVPEHDVFERLSEEEYGDFYERVKVAAELAREAFDADSVYKSATKWRQLFGSKFPEPPKPKKDDNKGQTGFSKRNERTTIGGNRFA
ncbi:SMODS domain-containing nucleotidyltransferase [Sutcliffiella horikoshii]|uniref:SMODS domain-containing nucleotidyltransferase n=1 Tax=Sutcliffiella TaxID=2837511 RepID=UPI001CD2F4DD|nr:nucleotidyltransferase [Bacillus tianshenii]MCA1319381.1 nucleotidyltransferase [Bacillus tianshenii]